jgi:hypothetical protein
MDGCGNCYYLTQADKKQKKFIGVDDLVTMLIYINGKPHKFRMNSEKGESQDMSNTGYTLDLKTTYQKKKDDEYYIFRGILTIRLKSKVVYQQKVIGDGGC